jgi:hypothetical protein
MSFPAVFVDCLYVVLCANGSPFLSCNVHFAVLCELLAYFCCRLYLMLVMWYVVDGGGLCGAVVGVILVYFNYVCMFLL